MTRALIVAAIALTAAALALTGLAQGGDVPDLGESVLIESPRSGDGAGRDVERPDARRGEESGDLTTVDSDDDRDDDRDDDGDDDRDDDRDDDGDDSGPAPGSRDDLARQPGDNGGTAAADGDDSRDDDGDDSGGDD
jgi:hypothetical protein